MVSVKSLLLTVGAVTLISTNLYAADLPPPVPYQYQQPAPLAEQSAWYLRGDVGVGVQNFSQFDLQPPSQVPPTWLINQQSMQDATLVGFGVGYEFNTWLRFDVTGEYRTKAAFSAIGSYNQNNCTVNFVTGTCFDNFTGNFSAAVFMANAYLDLGTWWCITPYIGGGVGAGYDRISGVQDIGPLPPGTVGFGFTQSDSARWNLAWNVQAGLTYNVSDNLKVDFNWRYLNLGNSQSADIFCQNTGTTGTCNFFNLKDVTSQDFRIGLRWMLRPTPATVVMPPPLSTRG